MSLVQCMGGWCGSRESCAHYLAEPTSGRAPAERLCGDCAEPVLWKEQAKRVDRYRAAGAAMVAAGDATPWAEHWAGQPPLTAPMTTGEPQEATA